MPGSPLDVVHFSLVLRELSIVMISPSSMHIQPSSVSVLLPSSLFDMVMKLKMFFRYADSC